jgi:uncharacterized SAM-binding protein YcdF (DUF218 family)
MGRFLRWGVALRVVLVLVAAGFVYFLVTFVQVWRAARADNARPSQAIVVLGAAQYDGRPSDVFRARLDHAADLYEDGIAPTIVVTGGKQEGDRFTEATAGAEYLHSRGVPDSAILRETTSHSSWESLSASANFLEARGMTRVVLVSDPFHSLRIESIADDLGLDAATSPTRTSPIGGIGEWWRFVTETLRVAVGRVIGFERLARGTGRVGRLVPGLGILVGPSGVV